jgi:hypothetical protein
MAKVYKILAQVNPGVINTTTTLYGTRAAGTQTVVSTLAICNTSATDATYKIIMRPNAESETTKHLIVSNATVPGNDSVFLTNGFSLSNDQVIEVQASTANIAFTLFGAEVS